MQAAVLSFATVFLLSSWISLINVSWYCKATLKAHHWISCRSNEVHCSWDSGKEWCKHTRVSISIVWFEIQFEMQSSILGLFFTCNLYLIEGFTVEHGFLSGTAWSWRTIFSSNCAAPSLPGPLQSWHLGWHSQNYNNMWVDILCERKGRN